MTTPQISISPIRVTNANVDRYAQDLRASYAGLRVWDPDFAIERDPWIYEKMLRDPLIRQCLSERIRSVAGGTWAIHPARNPTEEDEKAAKVMEQIVGELENHGFQAARVNLARFLWEGSRHALVYGRRGVRDFGDESEREWWYPNRLRDVNKRRVRVWRENGKVVKRLLPIIKDGEVNFDMTGDDWPSDRIITAVYDDEESRLGFGRGLGDSVYWFFYLKWKLMEEGIDAARKWAQGVTVGKVEAANIGDVTQTSTAIRDEFATVLQEMVSGGVVVVGADETIERYDGTGEGAEALIKWLMWCDDAIRGILTGARLPSGGGEAGAGSLARAEVEQDTSEGVYQIDSQMLDESVTEGLIEAIWIRNRENFEELGLGKARMPSYKSVNEKKEDFKENAEVISMALESGVPLVRIEVYEKMGLTPPTPEDIETGNVIEKAPEPDQFGGMGDRPNAPDPFAQPSDSDPAQMPDGVGPDGEMETHAEGEQVAAEGVEPPSMQELSLALERAIKNNDRATANIVRPKLWAVMGEGNAPEISDAEWETMTGGNEPQPVASFTALDAPVAFTDMLPAYARPVIQERARGRDGRFAKRDA